VKNSSAGPVLISMVVATALCLMLLAACGGDTGSAPEENLTPTPYPTRLSRAVIEVGATVVPIASQIGDCLIERNAQCPGADLREADLGVIMVGQHPDRLPANLRKSNFEGADFTNAFLERVDFSEANLRNANLTNAILISAVMYMTDLRGANLTGADFEHADMEDAMLDGAIFCNTIMPDPEFATASGSKIINDDCP